jgi:phosphoglycerol transferase MdoB-like AlkP superfamily enzyme
MAAGLILRLVLFIAFGRRGLGGDVVLAFLSGLWRDLLVGIWLTLPVLGWLVLGPERRFRGRWHRFLFWSACLLFWFGQTFVLFAEYYFFDEFRSRFNTVAVDYLQYPREVFVNIWDSYHVGAVLCLCLIPAIAWVWSARRLFSGMWQHPLSHKPGLLRLAGMTALAVSLAPIALIGASLAGILSSPLNLKGAHVSDDRTLNEIANNGELAFFAAALTHHLDYAAFYKTIPKDEAYRRVRRLLSQPGTQFSAEPDSLRRQVAGDPARPRLNLVIFLEESFGSEFWGCLGRTDTLTPEMDKLATQEGMLFTNLYASGNRTVRGMEGVLASFPPLPGESIVKRDLSDHVETMARLLKRDGYSTLFLYGGHGVFDGMRSFAIRNGYDRFIEQKHFEHPTFTTIWGVCDEDLYARSVEEFRQLSQAGKPFFATVLTVSNHKPYTYPRGRITEDPDQRRRENAVKYCDYALGEFFRAAKKETFWTNTIFAVVADHGARVYGSQSIPIHSYEIPLLIAGPAAVKSPERIGELGGSLDVAPTLLGLIGRPYESIFFGRDLLNCRPQDGRAWLNHNRDIGMLAGERLVVLGLMKSQEFYAGNPQITEMKPLQSLGALERETANDAMAFYQVADDLYTHQRYRIEPRNL